MKKAFVLSLGLLALTACQQPATPDTPDTPLVRTVDFTGLDGKLSLRPGKSGKLSLDAEPEYIAVSGDSRTAYVTLQESNALATVEIATGKVKQVAGLGLKDHSKAGNGLDASDKDGKINIRNWPVFGAYMPDAVAAFEVGGQTYLITANEGDTRDYDGFSDEVRVNKLKLDAAAFPNVAELQKDAALGRLTVSRVDADTDGDGDADRLVAFGARSASIWRASDLSLLSDTGDLFERKVAELAPASFNSDGTAASFDTRSDNKGPEPEGVTVGTVGGKTFSFVGLERAGGLMVLDVSNPAAPAYADYVNFLGSSTDPKSGEAGDLAPEGVLFIPGADSPSGQPLLVASHEVSGSVTVYAVGAGGKLTRTGRSQAAPFLFDEGVAEISAYDKASKQLFVVNGHTSGVDLLSLADPARPVLVKSVDLSAYGAGANSVAVSGGVIAVAVEAKTKADAGRVVFLNADGTVRGQPVPVGALPDMLTFTPDGQHLLVAGEGEPSDDHSVDPAGTVSIINVSKALAPR